MLGCILPERRLEGSILLRSGVWEFLVSATMSEPRRSRSPARRRTIPTFPRDILGVFWSGDSTLQPAPILTLNLGSKPKLIRVRGDADWPPLTLPSNDDDVMVLLRLSIFKDDHRDESDDYFLHGLPEVRTRRDARVGECGPDQ
jgi:hypothetical protein